MNIKKVVQVEYVKIYNDSDGFIVFLGTDIDTGKELTITGNTFNIDEGDIVECIGTETHHNIYGEQLKASSIMLYTPETELSILKYLETGYIAGITKKIAFKIVSEFGSKTIEILDNDIEKLKVIKGIGKKTLETIIKDWNEKRIYHNQNQDLINLGFSFEEALKLTKEYKENAVKIICESPYSLILLDSFSFKFDFIDKMALTKLGYERNNEMRILTYFLSEIKHEELNGNTYIEKNELLSRSYRKLRTDKDLIDIVLEATKIKKLIYELERDGITKIQRKQTYKLEEKIVYDLNRILKGKNKLLITRLKEKIEFLEEKSFKLYDEQKQVVFNTLQNKITIINGGPGVGKTTILKFIVELLKQEHYTFSLCAPTGKASQRMSQSTNENASTIHRLLEYNPQLKDFQKDEKDLLESDVIIVDEMSMVDTHLCSKILRAISSNSILIIIGDTNQIPSVSMGAVLKDLINSNKIPVEKLYGNRRIKEGSAILKNAYLINDGDLIEYDNKNFKDFFFLKSSSDEKTLETILKMVKDNIPNAFNIDVKKDLQLLTPVHNGSLGRKRLNNELQMILNGKDKPSLKRGDCIFKEGDNIIQIKNDAEKDIFNGDTGEIIQVDKNSLIAKINGNEIVYSRSDLDQIELSYAITMHKSQGSEYKAIIIPISNKYYPIFDRSLLYTGLTRGKELVIIIGNERQLNRIIKNDYSRNRKTDLYDKIIEIIK